MSAASRKTILIVEDNPADVYVIRQVLRECNLDSAVQVARDGQEGISQLQEAKDGCPALVLLDLNLPKVSGFEVWRYLRDSSGCKNTPVIIVTSSNAARDREQSQTLGAQAYFQKPASLEKYKQLGPLIQQVIGSPGATA